MNKIDDTISRAKAIDALRTWFRNGFDEDRWWNSTHVLAVIEGLPPAQPEIVTCDRCVAAKRSECIWHNAGATYCSLGEVTT